MIKTSIPNSKSFVDLLILIYTYRAVGQMSRVLAIGPGDRNSITGRVIPKTQKNVT